MCILCDTCIVRAKKPCRVLLRSFAASITCIHCMHARTTVEDHGCTGKGKHATQTTTQHFSRPMPLLLLYRTPSFGCSLFFVYRGLCKNHSINMRGHTQCYMYMNLCGLQLLYSSDRFRQVFFWRVLYVSIPRFACCHAQCLTGH